MLKNQSLNFRYSTLILMRNITVIFAVESLNVRHYSDRKNFLESFLIILKIEVHTSSKFTKDRFLNEDL